MLTGQRPTREAARALDVALILHADHELNASTFAARVTAATLSDLYSTAVAGIGALKGPLHGGANAEVMRMLLDLGEDAPEEEVERAIRDMLSKKQKVPGFGHRVYRTEDPRAMHLRRMSETLSEQTDTNWFAMSRTIEGVMREARQIDANVDFYSASTYHMLGIPLELFTPIFAVSRIAGVDGARPGTVRQQPPDPSPRRLHGGGAAPAVPATEPARIIGVAVRPPPNAPPADPQLLHHCPH